MGGLEKGLIPFDGVPLAVRIVDLLSGLFDEVILVAGSSAAYGALADRVIVTEDIFKGCGPLGGIHSGLARSGKQAAFCVACDMPYLSAALIRRQLALFAALGCDVLIPRIGREIEPLHGVYRKTVLGEIERILADGGGYSIRRLYPAVHTLYMELAGSAEVQAIFANLNSPIDLRSLER